MKTLSSLILVLTIALVSVSAVGAQEPPADAQRNRIDTVYDAISNATGLSRDEIIQMARQDGKTLAEIVSENGGDVTAVQAEIVAAYAADLNAQIDSLDERVGNLLNNPLPQPNNDRPNQNQRGNQFDNPALSSLAGIILQTSDIEPATLRQQLADGMTLADIASAAGLVPDEVAASARAQFQERLDEAMANGRIDEAGAGERLAAFTDQLETYLNTPLPDIQRAQQQRASAGRAILQAAAENLTVEPRDLLAAIGADQSMADYVTANGGDLSAVTAAARATLVTQLEEAVANGRIPQEDADTLLASLDSAIEEVLNTVGAFQQRDNNRGGQDGRGGQPQPPASDQQNG